MQLDEGGEGGVDLSFRAGLQDGELHPLGTRHRLGMRGIVISPHDPFFCWNLTQYLTRESYTSDEIHTTYGQRLSPKSGDNPVENMRWPLDPAVLIVLPNKAARV